MPRLLSFSLASMLSMLLTFPASASALPYTAVAIDALGSIFPAALAINDRGQVAGNFEGSDGSRHTFITGPRGRNIADLGLLGSGNSYVTGINDTGRITGYFRAAQNGPFQAFVTGPQGRNMTVLGTLGGTESLAYGINNSGRVTGYSLTSSGATHAFLTGPRGQGMTDIGTLGGNFSVGYGINNVGQITGTSNTAAGSSLGFITGPNGTGMKLFGMPNSIYTNPVAINDAGQATGFSLVQPNPRIGQVVERAFITTSNGDDVTEIQTPEGSYTRAYGINNLGQVVGDYRQGNDQRAFITGLNGLNAVDLDTLFDLPGDAYFRSAWDINNRGEILAGTSNGTLYLLSPIRIPEPGTGSLLLTCLGLMSFIARRRKDV